MVYREYSTLLYFNSTTTDTAVRAPRLGVMVFWCRVLQAVIDLTTLDDGEEQ